MSIEKRPAPIFSRMKYMCLIKNLTLENQPHLNHTFKKQNPLAVQDLCYLPSDGMSFILMMVL